ncbi:beta-carotene 15,15'-monooxygenase [Lysinibacillus sp. LZ02]|uniref:beta-carotene 15,15'-monooxygenase n=1 Tax=Lysinibacillus sp. LZ02 TaxID=3420668 RepID=UPI003D36E5C6
MKVIEKGRPLWLVMLLLLLISNTMLYRTQFGANILPVETNGVVLGSLIDFMIMLPLFVMLIMRKFSIKTAIAVAALGCILARLMIPSAMLEPYVAVTWVGLLAEVAIVTFEILLIMTFIRYIPKIMAFVKSSSIPTVFSFHHAIDKYVKKNPIIQILCSELLMFYYALFAWKKQAPEGITLHKNSSYIAFMVMIIHAIILETLGFHWWLHEKSMILSIVLLIINIYSVFFFLGDMNAVRLNPIHVTDDAMYISLGLMKRAKIRFADIDYVCEDRAELEKKVSKDTLAFIAREFEEGQPQMVLYMKNPIKGTLFMGFEKDYSKIAIRCDQPSELKAVIERGMAHI